jgi:hypothetical protein
VVSQCGDLGDSRECNRQAQDELSQARLRSYQNQAVTLFRPVILTRNEGKNLCDAAIGEDAYSFQPDIQPERAEVTRPIIIAWILPSAGRQNDS